MNSSRKWTFLLGTDIALALLFAVVLLLLVFLGAYYLTRFRAKIKENEELREAKAAAEEALREKSSLLENMIREIRTPINAVLGSAELILRGTKEEETVKYAEKIKQSGNAILYLINDAPGFSGNDAGKRKLDLSESEPASMASDLSHALESIDNDSAHKKTFIAPKAKLLLVDDTAMNLEVVKRLLKKTMVSVETALSGREALELLSGNSYDMLLFDHLMPEMNGIELLQRLREDKENPNCYKPCIVMTANAVSGVREEYLKAGFDDYMSKPINSKVLERLLVKYIPREKIELVDETLETANSRASIKSGEKSVIQKLDGISGIDVWKGIENNGNLENYISMLRIFGGSVKENAEEIEMLYDSGNIKDYTIKIHAMKSSLRIVGAYELGEEAAKLEEAGKNEDTAYIDQNLRPLLDSCVKLEGLLNEVLPKEERDEEPDSQSREKPVEGEEFINDAFYELNRAARDMDIDALEEILEQLDKYALPDNVSETVGKLKEACAQFDYGTVKELANLLN